MDQKEIFETLFPTALYFDWAHQQEWIDLLYARGWASLADPILSIQKAGEGNMNFVARARTASSSFIIKQSRPWVEKYPQIAAPVNRIIAEATFYQVLAEDDFFQKFYPRTIAFDPANFLLIMEDLGAGSDYTFLYQQSSHLGEQELQGLMAFLSRLHQVPPIQQKSFPLNTELKKLNHTHLFVYPFQENNGFDLDAVQPGLQQVSLRYKNNEALNERLQVLGERYLQPGNTLLHGDYYPGSWLKTNSGIKIIDPEFSHYGRAEFDLGVMMAHLLMARTEEKKIEEGMKAYQRPMEFDHQLFNGFCGVEIMRRILGLAQLPLGLSLSEKSLLLQHAYQLILNPTTQEAEKISIQSDQ
jgi:5-methylthioribose kinase